jgi:hypothetical protein
VVCLGAVVVLWVGVCALLSLLLGEKEFSPVPDFDCVVLRVLYRFVPLGQRV